MKKKEKIGKKLLACLLLNLQLFAIILILLLKLPGLWNLSDDLLVGAIIINNAVFITGNVGYALQRSAFFRPELSNEKEREKDGE